MCGGCSGRWSAPSAASAVPAYSRSRPRLGRSCEAVGDGRCERLLDAREEGRLAEAACRGVSALRERCPEPRVLRQRVRRRSQTLRVARFEAEAVLALTQILRGPPAG